ncbi:MAG: hypothetical protein KDN20_11890, partial [Verrucomicrobiae bacterium]|nr:hypothetical protein [Verrucomicrobiae bacterium]
TAGFDRRTPLLPEIQDNFLSFARHHFFGHRDLIAAPRISSVWDSETHHLAVTVTFPDGTLPESNALWWNLDRSEPYTLPFEYDVWESVEMEKKGPGQFAATIAVEGNPGRIDFLSLHTHTENGLPLSVSSPYQRRNLRVLPK